MKIRDKLLYVTIAAAMGISMVPMNTLAVQAKPNLKTVQASTLKDYQATYDKDVKAYNKAKEAVAAKQTELNNAVSAIEALNTKTKEKEVAIQAEQKAVDALKAEFDNVMKLTSKDFFTSLNDENALIVFESVTENTHLGDPNDATSLKNMKLALQTLKTLNEIRRAEGLQEVKVTSTLMAISQVQTNESSVTKTHSNIFSVGENLAFDQDTTSVYEEWYTNEKKVFNDLVSNTPELQDLRDQGLPDYKIVKKLTKEQFYKVGHYANTILPNYEYAGASLNTTDSINTVGNTYDYIIYIGDQEYALEEYEALLDAYMSENTPEAFKEKWQEAFVQLQNDQNALESMNQTMKDLETQKATAEKELTQLQSAAQKAKQTMDTSSKAYEEAKKVLADEKEEVPNTGDTTNTVFLASMLGLAGIGMLSLDKKRKAMK